MAYNEHLEALERVAELLRKIEHEAERNNRQHNHKLHETVKEQAHNGLRAIDALRSLILSSS